MIYTTSDRKQILKSIGNLLVESGYAAAYQISGPMESVYMWKEKKVSSKEWQMYIITQKKMFRKIETIIKEKHNYETPQIVSFNIDELSREYKEWIMRYTKSKRGPDGKNH